MHRIVISGGTAVEMPNKVYEKIASRVRHGAKLLDKKVPGWEDRIRTTELDMSNSCKCIYGQLHAEDLLNEIERAPGYQGDVSSQYGYTTPNSIDDWEEGDGTPSGWASRSTAAWQALQEEWLRQIKERRDAKVAA